MESNGKKEDPKSIKDKFKDLAEDIASETKEFGDKAKHVADEFSEGAQDAYADLAGQKESKRILAGGMGIIFGALGLHKFVLGYTREGLIMLLVSLLSFGFLAGLMALIGLVEGIVYLSKSEEDFYNTYQAGKKTWF
jgi:TM2 domain-containing membrane protein YozV